MSSICRHVVFLWETCFTFCRVKIFRIFAEFHLSDWFKFLFLKKKTKGISRLKNVCRMHCRHISALHKCSKMLLFIDNILVLCTEYIYIFPWRTFNGNFIATNQARARKLPKTFINHPYYLLCTPRLGTTASSTTHLVPPFQIQLPQIGHDKYDFIMQSPSKTG